jgi:hypothetical protein
MRTFKCPKCILLLTSTSVLYIDLDAANAKFITNWDETYYSVHILSLIFSSSSPQVLLFLLLHSLSYSYICAWSKSFYYIKILICSSLSYYSFLKHDMCGTIFVTITKVHPETIIISIMKYCTYRWDCKPLGFSCKTFLQNRKTIFLNSYWSMVK